MGGGGGLIKIDIPAVCLGLRLGSFVPLLSDS